MYKEERDGLKDGEMRKIDERGMQEFDQGYGRGGTPIFTGVFEPHARVALYPTDEDGSGTWFAAA